MASRIEEVAGKQITLRFEAARCIHSRQCVLGSPQVFVPNAPGEWIHPDAGTVEEIIGIAHACPSGAIRYERHDGGPQEAAPRVNLARVRENGPVALHAEMTVAGSAMLRATLCRCGASKNKPYCDGSHTAAGFAASGEPVAKESQPLAVRNGPLEVVPLKDGPLQVKGALEVVSGTGRTVNRVTETWLCRCGASKDKPYCDGSHRKIGFTAP